MEETAKEILDKVPKPIPLEPMLEKYPVMYEQSMNTVLIQEVIRYASTKTPTSHVCVYFRYNCPVLWWRYNSPQSCVVLVVVSPVVCCSYNSPALCFQYNFLVVCCRYNFPVVCWRDNFPVVCCRNNFPVVCCSYNFSVVCCRYNFPVVCCSCNFPAVCCGYNFPVVCCRYNFPVVCCRYYFLVVCCRYNRLLETVHSSLQALLKALKGLVVMSQELENMANSLFINSVPSMWAGKVRPPPCRIGVSHCLL